MLVGSTSVVFVDELGRMALVTPPTMLVTASPRPLDVAVSVVVGTSDAVVVAVALAVGVMLAVSVASSLAVALAVGVTLAVSVASSLAVDESVTVLEADVSVSVAFVDPGRSSLVRVPTMAVTPSPKPDAAEVVVGSGTSDEGVITPTPPGPTTMAEKLEVGDDVVVVSVVAVVVGPRLMVGRSTIGSLASVEDEVPSEESDDDPPRSSPLVRSSSTLDNPSRLVDEDVRSTAELASGCDAELVIVWLVHSLLMCLG